MKFILLTLFLIQTLLLSNVLASDITIILKDDTNAISASIVAAYKIQKTSKKCSESLVYKTEFFELNNNEISLDKELNEDDCKLLLQNQLTIRILPFDGGIYPAILILKTSSQAQQSHISIPYYFSNFGSDKFRNHFMFKENHSQNLSKEVNDKEHIIIEISN